MKIQDQVFGFIGTGAIAEAVVRGFGATGAPPRKMIVSRRNEERSARLAEQFSSVSIESDNQKIIDESDWVFLGLRPEQFYEVIAPLTFHPHSRIVSFAITTFFEDLSEAVSPAPAFRAIPLSSVEVGTGPVLCYPGNADVLELFSGVGDAIRLESEQDFDVLCATAGLFCSYCEVVNQMAEWARSKGVDGKTSVRYATSMFEGANSLLRKIEPSDLTSFIIKSATPGGVNEQTLRSLQEAGCYERIAERLDNALLRAQKKY